jgi:hypothetical protein
MALVEGVAEPAGDKRVQGPGAADESAVQFTLTMRGLATRQTVASYGGRDLRIVEWIGDTETLDGAIADAHRAGMAAVFEKEGGGYAVYRIESVVNPGRTAFQHIQAERPVGGEFLLANITSGDNSGRTYVQSGHPGLVALATADGGLIDARTGAQRIPPDPSLQLIQRYGRGLERLDREGVLRVVGDALRANAYRLLRSTESDVQDILATLNGPRITPADRLRFEEVHLRFQLALEIVHRFDQQIAAQQVRVREAYQALRSLGDQTPASLQDRAWVAERARAEATLREHQAELSTLHMLRTVAARELFPPLLAIADTGRLRDMTRDEQTAALRNASQEVLRAVATTRGDIGGRLNPWTMAMLLNDIADALGLQGERRQWVLDHAASERLTGVALQAGEAVLGGGLLVGAAFATDGLSLLLLAGNLGLGGHLALNATLDHHASVAAALAGVIPQDEAGNWAFVATSWIAAGFDAAVVANAIRLARAGQFGEAAAALNVSEPFVRTFASGAARARAALARLSAAAREAGHRINDLTFRTLNNLEDQITRRLIALAEARDAGAFEGLADRIEGGFNALADRIDALAARLERLRRRGAPPPMDVQAGAPYLVRGLYPLPVTHTVSELMSPGRALTSFDRTVPGELFLRTLDHDGPLLTFHHLRLFLEPPGPRPIDRALTEVTIRTGGRMRLIRDGPRARIVIDRRPRGLPNIVVVLE